MIAFPIRERLSVVALWMGVLVPCFYFGIQFIAAFFYPGYSFLNRDASTLGSDGSRCPAIFNVGAIVVGIMAWIASWGFLREFRHHRIHPILAWPAFLALVSFGIGSINAGVYPLPNPRHSEGALALIGIGTILLPVLIPAALWKLHNIQKAKRYFILNSLSNSTVSGRATT